MYSFMFHSSFCSKKNGQDWVHCDPNVSFSIKRIHSSSLCHCLDHVSIQCYDTHEKAEGLIKFNVIA